MHDALSARHVHAVIAATVIFGAATSPRMKQLVQNETFLEILAGSTFGLCAGGWEAGSMFMYRFGLTMFCKDLVCDGLCSKFKKKFYCHMKGDFPEIFSGGRGDRPAAQLCSQALRPITAKYLTTECCTNARKYCRPLARCSDKPPHGIPYH